VEEQLRGVAVLTVHDGDTLRVDEVANRAAASGEPADVAAKVAEDRRDLRRLLLGSRERQPADDGGRETDDRRFEKRSAGHHFAVSSTVVFVRPRWTSRTLRVARDSSACVTVNVPTPAVFAGCSIRKSAFGVNGVAGDNKIRTARVAGLM